MRKLLIIITLLIIPTIASAWGLIGFVGTGVSLDAPISSSALDYNASTTLTTVTQSANILLAGQTAMSFEAIIKADSAGESNGGRIFEKSGIMYLRTINVDASNGKIDVIIVHTGTNLIATTGNFLYSSEHHIVVVYNEDSAKKCKIYIDGVLASLTVDTAGTGDTTGDAGINLFIGNEGTSANTFDGYIRDLRWYLGKSLTQTEVTSRYANEVVSGKTSHWDFTEGSGTDLADNVNGDDGTIANGSWVTP